MEARLSLVTLGVPDLPAARAFYVDGLGWQPILEMDEVVFLQVGHGLVLSLFGRDALAADAEVAAAPPGLTTSISLACLVGRVDEVAVVIAAAEAAGGTVVKPAQHAFWGGHHGYFADPAGFLWEVAYNPGLVVDADGTVGFAEIS